MPRGKGERAHAVVVRAGRGRIDDPREPAVAPFELVLKGLQLVQKRLVCQSNFALLDCGHEAFHEFLLAALREHERREVALFDEFLGYGVAYARRVNERRFAERFRDDLLLRLVPRPLKPHEAHHVAVSVKRDADRPVLMLAQVPAPARDRQLAKLLDAARRDLVQAERVALVVGRLGLVELLERLLWQHAARVVDFGLVQDSGGNRVAPGDLVVGVALLAGLRLARHLVEPVSAPLDVSDDAHGAARGRERGAYCDERLLAHAARLVQHRGVHLLAVEVVGLFAGLEPDVRAVDEVDAQLRLVLLECALRHGAAHARKGHLRLRIDRRHPPVVATGAAHGGLLTQPHQASGRLARLSGRLDERIPRPLENRRLLLRVELRAPVADALRARDLSWGRPRLLRR